MKTRRPFRVLGIAAILFVGIVAGGLWYAPRFFERQLEQQIQDTLRERLYGEASYETFSLSFFPRFPDLSITLSGFQLSGRAGFPEPLLRAEALEISLNFWAFWQDRYQLTDLKLQEPDIRLFIKEDGTGNYSVFRPADTLHSDWTFEVENWQLEAGALHLRTPALRLEAEDLTHKGYGRIWQQQFELESYTEARIKTLKWHQKTWMEEQNLRWEADWQWNRERGRISWNENTIELGELYLELIGSVTAEQLNLELIAADVGLRELFPLLPPPLDTLQLRGKTDLNGLIRGDYKLSENRLPKMNFSGTLREGSWDDTTRFLLPLHDIESQWMLENHTDSLSHFKLTANAFKTRWGAHQLEGEWDISQWKPLHLSAMLDAEFLLHEPLPYLPDSLTLDGTATGQLEISGDMAPADSLYPDIKGSLQWVKGRLNWQQNSLRAITWEEVEASLVFESRYEQPQSADLRIERLTGRWEEKRFSLNGRLYDAHTPQLELEVAGTFDLSVLPTTQAALSGTLELAPSEIQASLADWEAGNYAAFLPRGTFTFSDLNWRDSLWVAEGLRLREGRGRISPETLTLEAAEGFWGDNAVRLSGTLTPATVLLTDTLSEMPFLRLELQGKYVELTHESWPDWHNRQKLAQWDIRTHFDELVFDGLALQNWEARLRTADTAGWQLQDGRFTWWRGEGRVQGSLHKSHFRASTDFSQIPLPKLHKIVWINQHLPLAPDLRGTTSGSLRLSGDWEKGAFTSEGTARLYDAVLVRSTSLMQALASFTGLSGLAEVQLRKDPLGWQLRGENCQLTPLGFRLGGYPAVLSGSSTGGQLDYQLSLQIPVGEVDEERLTRWFGAEEATWIKASNTFSLPLHISGTYTNPEIRIKEP